jgi:hypothetical protein
MISLNEMARECWSDNQKFLIRTSAKFDKNAVRFGRRTATACVKIYVGNPDLTNRREIFKSCKAFAVYELLDAIEQAENIGHQFSIQFEENLYR